MKDDKYVPLEHNCEVVLPKKIEPESHRISISNYQFIGNTEDRGIFKKYYSDASRKIQTMEFLQDKQISSTNNCKGKRYLEGKIYRVKRDL